MGEGNKRIIIGTFVSTTRGLVLSKLKARLWYSKYKRVLRLIQLQYTWYGIYDLFPILSKVKDKISQTCKEKYDESFLLSLIEWLENVVFDWMRIILPPRGQFFL